MSRAITHITEELIRQFSQQRPMRAGSLIVTVFGDAVAPRGGNLWLGSLIQVFADLQVSQRLVRTAAYRLVQANILQNQPIGRRSYYSLTDSGKQRFGEATERIYADHHPEWDGNWCLVLLANVPAEAKVALRKELQWLGFGAFGTDVMAHPGPAPKPLKSHLKAVGCIHNTVVLDGRLPPQMSDQGLQTMVHAAWDIEALGQQYDAYLNTFQSLSSVAGTGQSAEPQQAFYIRTLMIHEYRKVLLRDPALPDQLLPPDWQGHAAYRLTQELYRELATPAEAFIDQSFECTDGTMPPPDEAFHERFGGLDLPN